jgi:cleavage stimulation factor subunit 2
MDAQRALSDHQRQLLAQVFSLSAAQIEALPPDQRATILQLVRYFFS